MMQSVFYLVLAACVVLATIAFLCSGLLVINITPRSNGMGNHMFRYAAGMGLVERGFDVCWSNYSWDLFEPVRHEHSFFFEHVQARSPSSRRTRAN